MVNENGEEIVPFFIKDAVIITPGCVRICIVRGAAYYPCAGKWYEWQSKEAARAFKEARLLGAALKIPAKGVIGSDTIKDVEIYWNRRWKGRERLLVSWVMCS